jgi:beta-galactosidase
MKNAVIAFKLALVIYLATIHVILFASPGDLQSARRKLAELGEAVAEAKAAGIDTRYEEITLTTAGLFLNTYIPWDMDHAKELETAYAQSGERYLKGTPEEEAIRTPVWELEQTTEIIEEALSGLAAVMKRPDSRRSVPDHDVSGLIIEDGFLNTGGAPAFSGGFIWAPYEISKAYFGLIGNDVGFPELIGFNSPQSDGSLSDSTIARMVRKLDYLQENNQKGSIGFGHRIPRWAVDRWPDIDDYSTHHFNYDLDHPEVKGLWANLFSQLVPAVYDHPSVFDYQLAIEPQWPSRGTWQVNNVSPYTRERYRAWLKERYSSINRLNHTWGTEYEDFSQAGYRPEDDSNPAAWYDWCRFNQWRVTDFFQFMRDQIHSYDPNTRCHIRVSTGGINQGRGGRFPYSSLHNGIDREALVEMTEINGLDNFMEDAGGRRTHDLYDENDYGLNWLGHTMVLNYIRSLAPDHLIYDSEWHAVSSVYYLNPELPKGYMHTALWLSSLHGLGATKTWYWSRRPNGSPGRFAGEFYGSVLVQPRLLNEYGIGLAELNAFGREVVALERAPKRIYFLYSEPSAIQSLDYLNNQMIAYEALFFSGLPAGFVTENDLRTDGLPSDCQWLIIADASHVHLHTLNWLRDHSRNGGKILIVGNDALKYDPYGNPRDPGQLKFLEDLDRLDVKQPNILLGEMEGLMKEIGIQRKIRCLDPVRNETAWGMLCRSVEDDGGQLVCLINLSSEPEEVRLELNGNPVSGTWDLLHNQAHRKSTIRMDPLTMKLLKINK